MSNGKISQLVENPEARLKVKCKLRFLARKWRGPGALKRVSIPLVHPLGGLPKSWFRHDRNLFFIAVMDGR